MTIGVPWYDGFGGPNEVDLMRGLEFIINAYKNDPLTSTADIEGEISRAVNWLHAKYGGVRYDE